MRRTATALRSSIARIAALCLALPTGAAEAGTPPLLLAAGPHDVALREVTLHYVVRGKGPLLFVTSPGWGFGSTYLQNGLAPLERTFTLVYLDTRGSGGSTRPADRSRMSQEVMADDLDAVRTKLGLETIDLLGHSDGGSIAIDYAERHGDHLHRLVVADGCVLGDPDAKTYREALLKLWADDPHYSAAVKSLTIMPPESRLTDQQFGYWLNAITPLYLSDPDRLKPILDRLTGGSEMHIWAGAAEDEAADKADIHQLTNAGSIRSRTLIINGTVDWICPYQSAQNLHARVPDSRLSLYVNKGHFPWIEDPTRFFQEITGFLSGGNSQ